MKARGSKSYLAPITGGNAPAMPGDRSAKVKSKGGAKMGKGSPMAPQKDMKKAKC